MKARRVVIVSLCVLWCIGWSLNIIAKDNWKEDEIIHSYYENMNYCPFSVTFPDNLIGIFDAPAPAPNHGCFIPLKEKPEIMTKGHLDYHKGHFIGIHVQYNFEALNGEKVIRSEIFRDHFKSLINELKTDDGIDARLMSLTDYQINNHQAKRGIFEYRSNVTGKQMIYDEIFILTGCDFFISLVTSKSDYQQELPQYLYVVNSWHEVE